MVDPILKELMTISISLSARAAEEEAKQNQQKNIAANPQPVLVEPKKGLDVLRHVFKTLGTQGLDQNAKPSLPVVAMKALRAAIANKVKEETPREVKKDEQGDKKKKLAGIAGKVVTGVKIAAIIKETIQKKDLKVVLGITTAPDPTEPPKPVRRGSNAFQTSFSEEPNNNLLGITQHEI